MSAKKFTKEFKEQAVRLVLDDGLTQNEVARRLDIHQSALCRWVRKVRRDGKEAFPGKGRLTSSDQKIAELQQKLGRATQERDLLKKAISFFARSEL